MARFPRSNVSGTSPKSRHAAPHGVLVAGLLLLAGATLATLRHADAGDSLPAALDARLRATLVSGYAASRHALPRTLESVRPGAPVRPDARAFGDGPIIPCFIEGTADPSALQAAGARLGTELAGRRTARVPLARLAAVARVPGVRRMRAASRVEPLLDLSRFDTRADLVHAGAPDTAHGMTGEGVLVGVVDSGIAWQHPDFKTSAGTTRIALLWDQTDALGPPPPGFAYGTEWTPAEIDLGVPREQDSTFFGHGTHVAGIAAGNGRGTGNSLPPFRYVGVAPRARLGIVSTTFYDTDIVDGVAWLFQRAAALDLPCVVNLSLGSRYGPHDGTSDFDLAMNALSGPGRIIVAGAGNENMRASHAEVTAPPTGTALVTFLVYNYAPDSVDPDGVTINGWYEGGDNLALTVRTPSGALVGPVTKGSALTMPTPDGWVSIDQTGTEMTNVNGDVEVLIEVSDAASVAPTPGFYEIRVARLAAPHGGQVDFWIVDHSLARVDMAQGRTERRIVLSPATADSVIAVAAHTTRTSWQAIDGNLYNFGNSLNQIANFSSIGPRRDNVLKPDLSAPGSAIGAAHSPQSQPNPAAYILPDGVHKIIQGTSMSAPHVSGAVAILLSGCKILEPGQARSALTTSARTDAFTGAVPNTTWGHGKLDLERLLHLMNDFTLTIDAPLTVPAGTAVPIDSLCVYAGPGRWRIPIGDGVVSDSHGWLAYSTGGPPLPVAVYQDSTPPLDPGQTACIPGTGQLFVHVPPGAAPLDSTVVSFTLTLRGLPFMSQTVTTRVQVAGTSGTPPEGGSPAHLDLRVLSISGGRFEAELALPAAAHARVDLFDVAGRRVAALLDERVAAGRRRLTWPGADAPRPAAGLYFLTLQSDADRVVRRVVLAR